MTYLLVRHKIKDFATWKPVFDEHAAARKANGSQGGHVFRNASNPNEIIVLLKWDNLANARKFTSSEELQKAMMKAGVADKPDIYFLDEMEKVSV